MTNEDVKVILLRKIEAMKNELVLQLNQLSNDIVWAVDTSTVSTEFDNTKRVPTNNLPPLEKKNIPPPRKPNGYKSQEEKHEEAVSQLESTVSAMFDKNSIPDTLLIKNFNTDGHIFEVTLIDPAQNIQAILTVTQDEYDSLLVTKAKEISYLTRDEIENLDWLPILAHPIGGALDPALLEETVNG